MKTRLPAFISLVLLAALLLTACSGSPKTIRYAGHYTASDSSTLDISESGGSYTVKMGIFRLTELEGTGTAGADGLNFTATDAAGNPIKARVTVSGETATVTFTGSSWSYIKTGDVFTFRR